MLLLLCIDISPFAGMIFAAWCYNRYRGDRVTAGTFFVLLLVGLVLISFFIVGWKRKTPALQELLEYVFQMPPKESSDFQGYLGFLCFFGSLWVAGKLVNRR